MISGYMFPSSYVQVSLRHAFLFTHDWSNALHLLHLGPDGQPVFIKAAVCINCNN
jgi:hypothetical protein